MRQKHPKSLPGLKKTRLQGKYRPALEHTGYITDALGGSVNPTFPLSISFPLRCRKLLLQLKQKKREYEELMDKLQREVG